MKIYYIRAKSINAIIKLYAALTAYMLYASLIYIQLCAWSSSVSEPSILNTSPVPRSTTNRKSSPYVIPVACYKPMDFRVNLSLLQL